MFFQLYFWKVFVEVFALDLGKHFKLGTCEIRKESFIFQKSFSITSYKSIMLRRSISTLGPKAGLVGLPNQGKSTLFNSLTCSSKSATGNYDFCTIDAVKGKVTVIEPALQELAKFANSKKLYPSEVDLVDVAGLIKGASKGAGLGNKFLADIRPVTVILQTIRCFESEREGFDRPSPLDAIATIDAELVLADLESVEKRVGKNKRTGGGSAAAKDGFSGFDEAAFTKQVLEFLEDGKSARDLPGIQSLPPLKERETESDARKKQIALIKKKREALHTMQLLSAKPTIFVLNVDEDSMVNGNEFSKMVEDKIGADRCVKVCALIEEQTAQMEREERLAFLKDGYGIERPAVEDLMRRVYDLLKLQSFYTVGPQMAKAWPVKRGITAKKAAGEIHGDFEKFFVSAKVCPWHKFIKGGNLANAEAKMMFEVSGSYLMEEGDVMIVDHNAPGRK